MSQAVVSNNRDKWEPFTFRDRAINSDLFIGPRPSFVSSHVKIEAWLI